MRKKEFNAIASSLRLECTEKWKCLFFFLWVCLCVCVNSYYVAIVLNLTFCDGDAAVRYFAGLPIEQHIIHTHIANRHESSYVPNKIKWKKGTFSKLEKQRRRHRKHKYGILAWLKLTKYNMHELAARAHRVSKIKEKTRDGEDKRRIVESGKKLMIIIM